MLQHHESDLEHFNSRPHEEVDILHMSGHTAVVVHFNSRPHEEVDKEFPYLKNTVLYFNSRPHEEVDTTVVVPSNADASFQLTTSRRGRQHCIWK